MAELTTRVVDPSTLDEAGRQALADSLYVAHCDIFDGVDRDAFVKYVVLSSARKTRIQVFDAPDGSVAGYVAVHEFDRTFQGQECVLLRAEAGLRRDYRGANAVGSFVVRAIVERNLALDGKMTWYMGSLVHPSSYVALCRHAPQFWPNPHIETPPEIEAFMCELAEDFHLEQVDPSRPLVRDVGWITRDTQVERDYWRRTRKPLPAFFVEQNPGFTDGHGLVTLIPMDAGTIASGIAKWGSTQVSRRFRRMGASLRAMVGMATLTRDDALEVLAETELFRELSAEDRARMLALGTQQELPARTVLFHQGDRGDAMYLVLRGSAYIIVHSALGDPLIVDQLDQSDVFGEMALITRRPRSATIRAATDLVVLRIDAASLERLGREVPAVTRLLWSRVGQLAFDNIARASGVFDIGRRARLELWDGSPNVELDTEASWTADGAASAVVYRGMVHAELDGRVAVIGAPALLEVRPGDRLVATEPTSVRLLGPAA